ncbi:S-adenosylmethionine:tRNA ribosyltransferase-isomerase [Chryseosolibacter indicus]|uniref:S-adenosylmethionine:tRNA ribosyltransferase-isomerase n=1 Tax=Chryseosolibacter indicus TaxID=2782351 RepID=A0ABS5VTW0_9BACT|nr:S-adenosylmethionine:tRNA ribosyltransferase-isomerase [Chryseosolibacter indicus]MBT1704852.1 S-adenosylmethionine:tRNA ribosyltransferase-isomerase [Chryseosolibacter indicus]
MDILNLRDFEYDLPQERIALYPLAQRDEAKLLISKGKNIAHTVFKTLPEHLPANAFLFFNNTKVIPARLQFEKDTGAQIEIFLLNPVEPSTLLMETMKAQRTCTWNCTIGNLKRWNEGLVLVKEISDIKLEATLINRVEGTVRFVWNGNQSFAEVIESIGKTPLPPYLRRPAEEADRDRYQTIYSHYEGAVAAPTAGLHFTTRVFDDLKKRNIPHDFLTLHVSAGTFQPIKTENVHEHVMHKEQIIVHRHNVESLLTKDIFVIPVGTTSMRTLESLYWYGVKLLLDKDTAFNISQQYPYSIKNPPSQREALQAILSLMEEKQTDYLVGETSIFIKPGYSFKICSGLITNFHQPGSTLILLIATLLGEHWKQVYQEALDKGYRFLSYGDSSLLIP